MPTPGGMRGTRGFGATGLGAAQGPSASGGNQNSPNHPSQSYDPNKTNTVVGEPDKAKLSKDLVEKLSPETLKALIEGGHGISGGTYGGLSTEDKDKVDNAVFGIGEDEAAAALEAHQEVLTAIKKQAIPVPPHIDKLTPQVAATLSMNQLSPQQQAALVSRYGSLKNMGYIPGLGIMGLQRQPTIKDITTGEILGYPSEGLTGWPGMAADFLGIDTSGMNFGIDPEAEREATRGQEPLSTMELLYPTEGGSLAEEEIEAAQDPILSGYDLNYIDSVDQIQPYTTFAAGGLASLPANFNPMTGANPFRMMMRGGRI